MVTSEEEIMARAHQIARVMPDMYPFGFAVELARGEARGEKMPWDRDDLAWQERLVREGRTTARLPA